MAEAVPIRCGVPRADEWQTRLPLYAVASGDRGAGDLVRQIFGPGVDFPKLWEQAATAWRADAAGLHVQVHSHPTLQPNPPAWSGQDCLLFDPWDDGHARACPDELAVFKRSMPPMPASNEIAYPAWVRSPTLDLRCGPAPDADRPVVTFCGVAHRPRGRTEFIERFEASPAFDVRVIRRDRFAHPDPGAFLDSIREAHFVLCPAGVGRFSYRLYETLAAGRIPIVPPGTHTIPPALLAHAYICLAATPEEVLAKWPFFRRHFAQVHERNRAAWIRHASPLGTLVWLAAAVRQRLEVVA